MMWGSSGTCGGTCSCPRCGHTFNYDDSYIVYTGDNGYYDHNQFYRAYGDFKAAVKVSTKWRIWHRSPIAKCPAAILPLYAGVASVQFLRAHSASSAAQVSRQKRRARVQRLYRTAPSVQGKGRQVL